MTAPIQNATRFGSLHVICRRNEPIRVDVFNDGNSTYMLNNQKRGDAFDFTQGTKRMHPAPQDRAGVLEGLAKYFEMTAIAFPEHAELRDRLRGVHTASTPAAPHDQPDVQFNPDQGDAHIVMARLDQ